jgi:predicted Zn-dependent peptidase
VLYPDQPMGWPILGHESTVSAFTQEELRTYMTANYRAGDMTLVSSGAVDHAAIVRLAEEMFAPLRPGPTPSPLPAIYVGGDVRYQQDLEQAHIVYALPGVASSDADFYVAQVYVTALGGGMSSRLFQEAREKRGLCYAISAFVQTFRDTGTIGIYAGTGEREAGEISGVIAGEMENLATGATESEVARAKAQLKSSLLMGLERPGQRAEQIASQMFSHGRVLSIPEMTASLDRIDAAAVRRFADQLMQDVNPAIAAVGPVGRLEKHEDFARRFRRAPAPRTAELPKLRLVGEVHADVLAKAE